MQQQQQAAGCYIKQRGAASNFRESLNRESATRERAVTAVYLQLGIFITDYEEIYLWSWKETLHAKQRFKAMLLLALITTAVDVFVEQRTGLFAVYSKASKRCSCRAKIEEDLPESRSVHRGLCPSNLPRAKPICFHQRAVLHSCAVPSLFLFKIKSSAAVMLL